MSFEAIFKGNPSLKNRFPFRPGTTSSVIPADLEVKVTFLPDGLLAALVNRPGRRPEKSCVLTAEIFDEEALNQSLHVLRRVWQWK
ncbi:MAG: hypothetical protein V1766_09880 [Pseudomonadota bacterium]